MRLRSRKYIIVTSAALAGMAAAALLVLWGIDYTEHQKWLLQDARTLQPYRYVLMDDGQDVPLSAPAASGEHFRRLQAMARVILNHNRSQNLLLSHLSMSEPRQNLWRNRVYVKVYIVTQVAGLPPDQQRTRKVKAVYTIAPASEWMLVKTIDRTIE